MPGPVPGSTQMLNFHHYGTPGAGPKAYLQAALHADETPGLLVLYKLLQKLDKADARGEIEGSIIVAPFANPVGLNQFSFGAQQGRFMLRMARTLTVIIQILPRLSPTGLRINWAVTGLKTPIRFALPV